MVLTRAQRIAECYNVAECISCAIGAIENFGDCLNDFMDLVMDPGIVIRGFVHIIIYSQSLQQIVLDWDEYNQDTPEQNYLEICNQAKKMYDIGKIAQDFLNNSYCEEHVNSLIQQAQNELYEFQSHSL